MTTSRPRRRKTIIQVKREAAGLTRKRFAEQVGVTEQTIKLIECRRTKPSKKRLQLIAQLLTIPHEQLVETYLCRGCPVNAAPSTRAQYARTSRPREPGTGGGGARHQLASGMTADRSILQPVSHNQPEQPVQASASLPASSMPSINRAARRGTGEVRPGSTREFLIGKSVVLQRETMPGSLVKPLALGTVIRMDRDWIILRGDDQVVFAVASPRVDFIVLR